MRIFQSLWTKPALDKRWDQSNQLEANIWLYTLSVIYAKKIGLEIVLHTDSLGKSLLSHLPYDKIYTTLNNIPSNIPTMIWAYGKFVALEKEPLGSIHIDGDVFLKHEGIKNKLEFSDYDMIVQNQESVAGTYPTIENTMIKYGVLGQNVLTANFAYNCGIIGFNNENLKQQYLSFYHKHVNKILHNSAIKNIMHSDKFFCVDLPLEQHSIATLSSNYKVKQLLTNKPGGAAITDSTIQSAIKIGYQHLIGKEKYSYIDRIKVYVLALDSELYYKTKKVIEKYKKIIS